MLLTLAWARKTLIVFAIMAASLPVTAAAPRSAMPLLSEQQFCALSIQHAQQMAGMKIGPSTITKSTADCDARTIHADYSLDFTVYDQPLYITTFMQGARGGVCVSNDPSMAEFDKRGWAFSYTFKFNDGMVIEQRLIC